MRWLWAVLALLVAIGCGGGGGSVVEGVQVEGADLLPHGDDLALSEVAAGRDIVLRVNSNEPIRIDGVPVGSGQPVPIAFDEITPEAHVEIRIGNETTRLYALPTDFPSYTVQSDDPKPGRLFLTALQLPPDPTQPSFLLIVDEEGATLFSKRQLDLVGDFKPVPGGYAYLERASRSWVFLDESFRESRRLGLLPTANTQGANLAFHDALVLGPDHYLLLGLKDQAVLDVPGREGVQTWIRSIVIQERRAGQAIFEWDSADHPRFHSTTSIDVDYAAATQDDPANTMHVNSVEVDPRDGHLILSFRHQSSVVKVHRQTGEVLWILGGPGDQFGLTDEQDISLQHDARMSPDGTLTLFDNGNANRRTRVLRMKLDEASKTVTQYESFEPTQRFSGAMGSVRFDGETALAGWGWRQPGESDATEWDVMTGRTRFELSYDDPDTGVWVTYRAIKAP